MKPLVFAIIALSAFWVMRAQAADPADTTLNSTDVGRYCDAFVHTSAGVWTTTKPVTLQPPLGRIVLQPGDKVVSGDPRRGMDLGAALDVACPQKAALPSSAKTADAADAVEH